ncbi:WD repeat-containing protein 35 [Caerostris extrusa]|uniref:WD repeat-containing protein 35 n=1 Tax=Caerostris extrusa TaxID=172846 RepID=A0AAV4VA70_CAEEX|nr:WD repeat-containing protein 35 [Caerostris extrusa]
MFILCKFVSAIDLHRTLGDSFRVIELGLKRWRSLEVSEMEEAWNGVADYYFDRQLWNEAVNYYEKAHNEAQIAECYYMLEDYGGLERLLNDLPENHKLLPELGSMFSSVGMCEQAVSAYVKCNKLNAAIECCTTLNQWKMAISLAQKYDIKDVDFLLSQYAVYLKQEKSVFTVVELYKKACKFLHAALMLYKFVKDLPEKHRDPLLLRKMHPPKDSRSNTVHCRGCVESIPDWYTSCPNCNISFPVCVASGRPIMNPSLQWTCLQCHHSAFKQEMLTRSCCALCHCTLLIPV